MSLIPQEELCPHQTFNFAPMIDFLFLMLALFATLAISRSALYDSEIQLTEVKPQEELQPIRSKADLQQINLSVTQEGTYKWLTEFEEYPMSSCLAIQEELSRQYQIGALSQIKEKTEVLLHIDKQAPWSAISSLIFSIKELGFSVHPVYEVIPSH